MVKKTVKVIALHGDLRYEGVSYSKGAALEIAEHMLQEWLALKHVRMAPPEQPVPAKVVEPKIAEEPKSSPPAAPAPLNEDDELPRMIEEGANGVNADAPKTSAATIETARPRRAPRAAIRMDET